MILAASMIAAGGLDYSVSVVAGRWLDPVDFGVFVSVTAMLQVLILLSIAIRMVVAVRTAELAAQDERRVGAFVRRVWRWSLKWGFVATAVAALTSPILAPVFQLSDAWPLWAGVCSYYLCSRGKRSLARCKASRLSLAWGWRSWCRLFCGSS